MPSHLPLPLLPPLFLLLLLLTELLPSSTALGINYGRVADDLPPPPAVLPLLTSLSVTSVKLYDTDPDVLRAFSGTPFDLTVGLPDRLLPSLANSTAASAALSFLNSSLLLPSANISTVTVGNEVLTSPFLDPLLLLPAMQSLHSLLSSLPLRRQVSITTAHSLAILSSSFPPSAAAFRPDLLPLLRPILLFLHATGSPFLVNAYPYFAYKADPKLVDLPYALSEPNSGVRDPATGLLYNNMLHAQVDAVHAAIVAAVGEDKARAIEVRVSETGWPSLGDGDEPGATIENAQKYNGNLMRMVAEGKGTPMRPTTPLQVFVFALFNENLKPGPTSERNYGLLRPDGSPVYSVDLTGGDGEDCGPVGPPKLSPSDDLQISSGIKVEWATLKQLLVVGRCWPFDITAAIQDSYSHLGLLFCFYYSIYYLVC